VVREEGRHLKLFMERNHSRVNQTSLDMLSSWRGNCDIQILIYESDPDTPDLREISRVTDYIVAYQCKGNTTYMEERETTKHIILNADVGIGGEGDLKRVCKQVMNKAASRRLISKQEASVFLADLPLTLCSEFMETVSISKTTRLKTDNSSASSPQKFLTHYASRAPEYVHLSLHEYFFVFREVIRKRPPSIPHYVGVNGYPCFPVSEGYARHVLICYKPWTIYPENKKWKSDFMDFICSKRCPTSPKLVYDRVKRRHYDKTKYVDPSAKDVDHTKNPIDKNDEIALLLSGMGAENQKYFDKDIFDNIDKGIEYQWDKPPIVSVRKSDCRKIISCARPVMLIFFPNLTQ